MLNQTYTGMSLKKLIKSTDFSQYKIPYDEDDRNLFIDGIINIINDDNYQISTIYTYLKSGKNVFYVKKYEDILVLRKINYILYRLYKVKQADRTNIVSQIKHLLQESGPMTIMKFDIQSFYESIDKDKVITDIVNKNLLSYKNKTILLNFMYKKEFPQSGLPRGINISATLSELYLERFDEAIANYDGVYFYARFVDDMIIFSYKKNEGRIKDYIEQLFLDLNLHLNPNKESVIFHEDSSHSFDFEFLGYKFQYDGKLNLSIADSKIKKYKTRIILALLDFIKNADYELLKKRIRFLTGNYPIRRSSAKGNLYGGIYYNYPLLESNSSGLSELTDFLQNALCAKSSVFGRKLCTVLTEKNRRELLHYTFESGFKNRKVNLFSPSEIHLIKKCWNNE